MLMDEYEKYYLFMMWKVVIRKDGDLFEFWFEEVKFFVVMVLVMVEVVVVMVFGVFVIGVSFKFNSVLIFFFV